MSEARVISVYLFSAVALVAGGCGGGSDGGKIKTRTRSLAAPLYASCGTGGFAKPAARALERPGRPKGWEVVYTYPRKGPASRPGETTTVTLLEFGPAGPERFTKGAQVIDVAGRKVSFYNRTKKTIYAARWKTDKAAYVGLANGSSPATFKKIISCLP